jgi:hypothetical protein
VDAVEIGVAGWVYDRYVTWEAAPVAGAAVIPVSREYGPKRAVYPLDADIVGCSHSWPTYNLLGSPKLSLEEKKGLTYGVYHNGRWSNLGKYMDPVEVNTGEEIIKWTYKLTYNSDFHGAIDLTHLRSTPRPIKVHNILKGLVVKAFIKDSGFSYVWVETTWRRNKIWWVYQHLHDKRYVKVGDEIHTGDYVGEVGYLDSGEIDRSHLHLECISKKRFDVPDDMILVCDSKTGLRSQFDYDRLESVGITRKHFMYNPIYLIDWINGLVQ